MGHHGSREWPGRSSELTPCDYFLWGCLKQEVYWSESRNLEQLGEYVKLWVLSYKSFWEISWYDSWSTWEADGG